MNGKPFTHSRAGSVYTLSRLSFSSQITQLTSIPLPQARALAEAIRSVPTVKNALCVLEDAAYRISKWIRKSTEVLSGLDANGEIEWAIAAGKSGISEVDLAISRFEGLINVYVECVEELRHRDDAKTLPLQALSHILDQIETIASSWKMIKQSLEEVKFQVELSMEWKQFQDYLIKQIEAEMDDLSGTVFEIEELRHQQLCPSTEAVATCRDKPIGISDISLCYPQTTSPHACLNEEAMLRIQNEMIIALSARMQPLRTSIGYLPIKYATFQLRAFSTFPSACVQLEEQIHLLGGRWERIVTDVEILEKELGEDKWLAVFQSAARQALKMIESVRKSIVIVDESLGSNTRVAHAPSTQRKIQIYYTKKAHYCPAIAQILSITNDGLGERTTINGEIVRLQAKLHQDSSGMKAAIKDLDAMLAAYVTDGKPGESISCTDSPVDLAMNSPSTSLITLTPSPVLALNTKSSCYQLAEQATGCSSIIKTPSSIRAQRSFTHLPVTPRTPSRVGNLVAPHSGGSMFLDTHSTPDSGKYRRVSPTVGKRPRWNYSTRLGSNDTKTNFSRGAATSSVPCHYPHTSPTNYVYTAAPASIAESGMGSQPDAKKTAVAKYASIDKFYTLPSTSSSPSRVPRMKTSGERCLTTVPKYCNHTALKTKVSWHGPVEAGDMS